MDEEKIKNVKITKRMTKLVGTIVLVDSLIVGVAALGGHTPIYQDNKIINMVNESSYKEWDTGHKLTISNYYQDEVDTRNRVIYYKKPFLTEKGKFREVETVYKNNFGTSKDIKIIPVDANEPDIQYIETLEYDYDNKHFITIKESLRDEIISDVTLLLLLGAIDTAIYSAGKNLIDRLDDEEKVIN